jgi:uncharacterized repeat protein (TIGR01451 family)
MKSQAKPKLSFHGTDLSSLTRIAAFVALIVLVALTVFPVFSSSIASSSSDIIRPKNALGTADQSSERTVERASKLESIWAVPGLAALAGTKSWFSASPSMALAGETVELFAADCTTPKTAFSLGETVCAKTNGVDLTIPGNYYMNWIDSQLNQTNGGTITQNPQYFLYVPPAADTYKATIGRVAPADSSIIGNPPLFTVSNGPGISTYTPDCLTPKTSFVLGNVVCATAQATGGAAARRRVVWIDPSGNARQVNDITTDPQSFSFAIPLTQTSVVSDQIVDNRGKWKVNIISLRSSVVATTTFVVTDPVSPSADLSVVKYSDSSTVSAGSNIKFFISVYNNGPNAAVNAVLNDPLPAHTTFYSLTQPSGPSFTCTTPTTGSAGTVNCTIASLPRDANAQFELTVRVDTGAANNTVITNTATVSSDTLDPSNDPNADPRSNNNVSSASVTVSGGGGGGTCTLTCPEDVNVQSNTTDPNNPNQPGAVVHYDAPTTEGTCGTLTFSHCNDCFFPEGDTVVSVSETTGESCQFNVTVSAASNAPTISCPSNKEVDANGACSVNVTVGTATATGGQNVTIFATRSDGKPMYDCDPSGNCVRRSPDAPFRGGVTTITWTATSHNASGDETGSASCTQTITVNNAGEDTTAPVITCPANITRSNDSGQCSAAINVGTATATDNCDGSPTVEGTRSDGHSLSDPYPKGTTTIHWTATDGSGNSSSCDQTVTVTDNEKPTISCPANMTANTEPGTCAAHVNPGTPSATDNCDTSLTVTGSRSDGRPLTDTYPKGTTTITWTATDDDGNNQSCAQTITVEDHENPVIVCPAPTTASADASCQAAIPDRRSQATTSDNCGAVTVTQSPAPGTMVGLGPHTITLTATDSSGNTSTCQTTFTVVDTTAPTFTFTGTQTMWPPNHKYQTFTTANLVASVQDNCNSIPISSVVITKVTSDEIENGNGDGNTLNDIVIAADCKSVQLRSEREGNSNGRVYTIFFSVTDAAGNKGTGTTKVVVPHNPGETAVDSGPHYTVTSNCP